MPNYAIFRHSKSVWGGMPRRKSIVATTKVAITIPKPVHERLERLALLGLHGSTPTEAAKYLVIRGLDDLMRSGVLPANEARG